jgi:hypothetical protein
MNYKTGDTIFLKADGSIESQLIHEFLGDRFTHCAILIENEIIPIILESTFGTNRRVNLLPTNRAFKILPTRHLFEPEIVHDMEHGSYSIIDLIKLGFSLLLAKLGIIERVKPSHIGEICTEFVQEALGMKPELLTPDQLYEKLSKECL